MQKVKGVTNEGTLKVYAFIRSYIEEHKYAPSIREIQIHMEYSSSSTVHYHMNKLFKVGLLETDLVGERFARAYRLGEVNL